MVITRVLLHQPKLLVLDEATSAIDKVSERTVQAALGPLMEDRTTVVIPHGRSTILKAYVICAIDGGQVVQPGSTSSNPIALESSAVARTVLSPRTAI